MNYDKLKRWAHGHAEDIELMYHEQRLITLADVVMEAVRRKGAQTISP